MECIPKEKTTLNTEVVFRSTIRKGGGEVFFRDRGLFGGGIRRGDHGCQRLDRSCFVFKNGNGVAIKEEKRAKIIRWGT